MAFFIFSVRDICVTAQYSIPYSLFLLLFCCSYSWTSEYSLTVCFFFFSVAAIAELLDNAVDEVCSIFWKLNIFRSKLAEFSQFVIGICCDGSNYFLTLSQINNGATFIKVDKSINSKDNSPMLVFQGTKKKSKSSIKFVVGIQLVFL